LQTRMRFGKSLHIRIRDNSYQCSGNKFYHKIFQLQGYSQEWEEYGCGF
jgi:hypothetical protein